MAFGPVWARAENSPPPVFDSRTVQLVASRCTDCAVPAHNCCPTDVKLLELITLYRYPTDFVFASCICWKKQTRVRRVKELFYKAANRILTHSA